MPRNASGVYTLPEPAFVAGTVIQSAPVNSDLSDIATALTLSVATTGVSTMTGPFKLATGSQLAPSLTFGAALATGFYLVSSNQIGWTANGTLAALFNSDGTTSWLQDASFADALSVDDIAVNTLAIATSATLVGHPVTNFPVGTVVLFNQTNAPTGWTKITTYNDYALRVVNSSVSTGGSVDFSTLFARTAVDNFTLTSSEMPAHSHSFTGFLLLSAGGGSSHNYFLQGEGSTVSAGTSVGTTGSGGAHTHNIDMRVKYVDIILAQKA